MLEAVDLSKVYKNGVQALDSLNLSVAPGEIFCMLGANGAGKTTCINLFLGFIQASKGTVFIGGLDVSKSSLETKKLLAYIPEQVMLYPNLSGLENLEYFAALSSCNHKRSFLIDALLNCGLTEAEIFRRISAYSKGMRQKVGIALAVVKEAQLLLLDEPTSGLDPKASNEFSELVQGLSKNGTAVFMVTHDIFRAKEDGTRIGIMKQGRLVDVLETDDIGHADLEKLYLSHMSSRTPANACS